MRSLNLRAGSPSWIPLAPASADPSKLWVPSGGISARRIDGGPLEVRVVGTIYPAQNAPGATKPIAPLEHWTLSSPGWRTITPEQIGLIETPLAVRWGLLVEAGNPDTAPGSQRVSTMLEVGDRSVRLQISDPPRLDDLWRGAAFDGDRVPGIVALLGELSPFAQDPNTAWRIAMLAERWGLTGPRLEPVARAGAERWRFAIDRLGVHDPDLARALARGLTDTLRPPWGGAIPLWSADRAESELLLTLLDPEQTGENRALAVEAWLDAKPAAAAWIINDGDHATGPSPRGDGALVLLANLTGRAERGSLGMAGVAVGSPTEVGPFEAVLLRATGAPTGNGFARRVVARLGGWSQAFDVVGEPRPASPPGVRLGPMLSPASYPGFLQGTATQLPEGLTTMGLLLPPMEGESGGWRLYLEVGTAGGEILGDRVELSVATSGRGIATMTVRPGDVQSPVGRAGGVLWTAVEADRWTAMIELPTLTAVDGGVVEIGLRRVAAIGVLGAWPRPTLPGQASPGRLRVDLSTWPGVPDGVRE